MKTLSSHLFTGIFVFLTALGLNAQNAPDYMPGQVWVTIDDARLTPFVNSNGDIKTGDSLMNYYLETYRVVSFKKPIPYSTHPLLKKTYEINCSCDEDSLAQSLGRDLKDGRLGIVAKVPIGDVDYTPNDYTNNFGCTNGNPPWYFEKINLRQAWDTTTGSPDIEVGVIDVWLNDTLTEFNDQILSTYDPMLDTNWVNYPPGGLAGKRHGTAVASIVMAKANNNHGIAGVAHDSKLRFYNAGLPKGFLFSGSVSIGAVSINICKAVRDGVDVITTSLRTYNVDGPNEPNPGPPDDPFGPFVQACLDEAYKFGVVVIASGGNRGADSNVVQIPAMLDHVIAVGATDSNDMKMAYATYRSYIDISAPGTDLITAHMVLDNNCDSAYREGTSFTAPMVAGVAALILSLNPCLSHDEVEYILKKSSVNIDTLNPLYIDSMGAGRLDALAAIQLTVDSFLARPYDIDTGLNITTNVTWNSDKLVHGAVVVDNKGVLTINNGATIEFDYANTYIEVRPGGKLIIDNATLTSRIDCERKMWGGVKVYGTSSAPQNPPTFLSQGWLVLRNGAIIENAHVGIQAGIKCSGYPEPCAFDKLGGGYIDASNATFKNNRIAVYFAEYNKLNFSSFKNCTFRQDDCLKDIASYDNANLDAFVIAKGGNGVELLGCGFEVVDTSGMYENADLGTAIRLYDTGLEIDSINGELTTFTNIYKAIDNYSLGNIQKNLEVSNAEFNGCYKCVTDNGGRQSKYYNNTFEVAYDTTISQIVEYMGGGGGTYAIREPAWALNLSHATAYKVYGNTIRSQRSLETNPTSFEPLVSTYGIIARNSFTAGSFITTNNIDTIDVSIQTEENNANLQMHCNSIAAAYYHMDINPGFVTTEDSLSIKDTIAIQGSACDDGKTAANDFDAYPFTVNIELGRVNDTVPSFYYYSPGFPASTIPSLGCSGSCLNNCGFSVPDSLTCIKDNLPGYLLYPVNDLGNCPTCMVSESEYNIEEVVDSIEALPSGFEQQIVANDVVEILLDKEDGWDLAVEFLTTWGTQTACQALVASFSSFSSKAPVQDYLGELNQSDPEINAFHDLYALLVDEYFEQGSLSDSLSTNEYATINTVANAGYITDLYAKVALAYAGNTTFVQQPQRGLGEALHTTPKRGNEPVEVNTPDFLKLHPNPAQAVVGISYQMEDAESIAILNLQGKVLLQQLLTDAKQQLAVANLPPGLYLVRLNGKTNYLVEKLVLIK